MRLTNACEARICSEEMAKRRKKKAVAKKVSKQTEAPAKTSATKAAKKTRKPTKVARSRRDDAPPTRVGITKFTKAAGEPAAVPEPVDLPDSAPPASVRANVLESRNQNLWGFPTTTVKEVSVPVTRQRKASSSFFI